MPALNQTHYPKPLAKVAIAFANQNFIADLAVPKIKVELDTDKYYVYGNEKYATPNTLVAHKALPKEIDWAMSLDSYYCKDYGLRELITDKQRKRNTDPGFDLNQQSTEILTSQIKLAKEIRARNLLFTNTNYIAGLRKTLAGAEQFDHANSTPVKLIKQYCQKVITVGKGMKPNLLVMGSSIRDYLTEHPTIVGRLQYTDPLFTEQKLAALFGVKKILFGEAIKNTADEGQTAVMAEVWDDKIAGFYVPENFLSGSGGEVESAGFISNGMPTFALQFVSEYYKVGIRRDSEDRGDWITVTESQDEKITGSSFGFIFEDVLAAA